MIAYTIFVWMPGAWLLIALTASAGEPGGPEWTDLGGHSRTLEAYRGRIVVLNFWATWCAPCRKEIPDLVRVQNRYGMYGVQVLGAAADETDAAAAVAELARKLGINFPVLLGATTAQMHSLGLGVMLPATVVLDRQGGIVERFDGVVERKKLEEVLDRMLRGEEGEHDHRHAAATKTQASLVPS